LVSGSLAGLALLSPVLNRVETFRGGAQANNPILVDTQGAGVQFNLKGNGKKGELSFVPKIIYFTQCGADEKIADMEQSWFKRKREEIVTGLIVCAAWGGVTYLKSIASPWFGPLFYGTVAGTLVLIACVAVILLKRAPRQRVIPTEKSIGTCVRTWLDNHRFAVRSDPCDEAYFRLQITLDSGYHMTILRSKAVLPDYVQIIADLGVRGDDKKLLEQFTDNQRTKIFIDIKRELARAKVGYSGLIDPPENFRIFRNVPIYSTLTEFAFISMIGDVEAAMNLVMITFLGARWEQENSSSGITLPSTSDILKLEPPVA
jgi:hypothetical protein